MIKKVAPWFAFWVWLTVGAGFGAAYDVHLTNECGRHPNGIWFVTLFWPIAFPAALVAGLFLDGEKMQHVCDTP